MSQQTPITLRGINYDVGTSYSGAGLSRHVWNTEDVLRDMASIKNDLHCNTVNLFGSDIKRIVEGAAIALEQGLQVTLQPRLADVDRRTTLLFLEEAARAAEILHTQGHPLILNIGCELTIFTPGIISGNNYAERMTTILNDLSLLPSYSEALNSLLAEMVEVARANFSGSLIYAAGLWEGVDWSPFDLIGLNYYRAAWNEASYVDDLRKFQALEKPIIITEFGCCTHERAAELGGGSAVAVDWSATPPCVLDGFIRSEAVQASYLTDLLSTFEAEDLYGAFVFEFMEPYCPHTKDPALDLDVDSFGITKVVEAWSGDKSRIVWEPKQAFTVLAEHWKPG